MRWIAAAVAISTSSFRLTSGHARTRSSRTCDRLGSGSARVGMRSPGPVSAVPLAQVANGEPIRLELRSTLADVAYEVEDGLALDCDPHFPGRGVAVGLSRGSPDLVAHHGERDFIGLSSQTPQEQLHRIWGHCEPGMAPNS